MDELELRRLTPAEAVQLKSMTFRSYHHLLTLEPAPRHPEQGDSQLVRALALGALIGNEPVGLALVELPEEGEKAALLSLFVNAPQRNCGLGTELVRVAEDEVGSEGFKQLEAVYMTGKNGIQAVERILQKRSWPAPETRTITVRFTPDEAASTPWFGKVRLPRDRYEIFEWSALTSDEREKLVASQRERSWIAPGLEPWQHDQHGFDEVSSVGVRYLGEVVGWVINHRVSPTMVRFTCSYIRKDLGRRGRIIPLFTESIRRLRGTECTTCSLITPVAYTTMVRFLKRRCAASVSFVGETRGACTDLMP